MLFSLRVSRFAYCFNEVTLASNTQRSSIHKQAFARIKKRTFTAFVAGDFFMPPLFLHFHRNQLGTMSLPSLLLASFISYTFTYLDS